MLNDNWGIGEMICNYYDGIDHCLAC